MKIAIAGHTGYIGSHVKNYLLNIDSVSIIEIDREDFKNKDLLEKKVKDAVVIINLAGYPVIKRWTKKNKKIIRESRVGTTKLLAECASKETRSFINASAIGIYDGFRVHDEESKAYGGNFLAQVVMEWEQALKDYKHKFEHIAMLRYGVVIGKNSPSWKMMKMPYKMKIGVQIGQDEDFFSFIRVEEIPRVIEHLIYNMSPENEINVVCPGSVQNQALDKAMRKRYGALISFRLPTLFLKIIYGKAAVALVESKNIVPRKLDNSSFNFRYSSVEESIRDI